MSDRCRGTVLLLGEFPIDGRSRSPQVLSSLSAEELNLLGHPKRVVRVSVLHMLALSELQSFWVVGEP